MSSIFSVSMPSAFIGAAYRLCASHGTEIDQGFDKLSLSGVEMQNETKFAQAELVEAPRIHTHL
jgi:hypothetical protein